MVREQHEIAGIDRHPEMIDAAAGEFDTRRDHVAAVDDGRGAENQNRRAALFQKLTHRVRHGLFVVAAADFPGQATAQRFEPPAQHLGRLVENALLHSGKARENQPGGVLRQARDADERSALGGDRGAGVDVGARRRKGNDLDRRQHLSGLDHLIGRHGGDR